MINESRWNNNDRISRTDVFAYAATGALIGDHRELAVFQLHGGVLDGAAFITTAADDFTGPGVTFFAIQLGEPHTDFFDGDIFQGVRRADGAAPHAQETGGFLGIDLGGAGLKEIKAGAHGDAVEDADLGALAALQAAG